MTKTDLINAIYEETGIIKKDVGSVVNSTFDLSPTIYLKRLRKNLKTTISRK